MPSPVSLEGVDLEKLVQRRHPEYEANLKHWLFAEISYRGGRQWFDGIETPNQEISENLFKFYKEGDQEFKSRKDRAHRANHTKRVVDTINQYLFREMPHREKSADATITRFWDDADGRGRPMDRMAKEIDTWLSVFGHLPLVVDRKREIVDRKQDESTPYIYYVFPYNLLDMEYDYDDGMLNWVMFLENYRDQSSLDEGGHMMPQWRIWSRTHWFLIRMSDNKKTKKRDYYIVDQGEHNLGRVPVVLAYNTEGSRWSAPGVVDDIIYMDRALVNYQSLLDEILYEQTFSQLTVPAEAIDPAGGGEGANFEWAMKRIFTYKVTIIRP